MKAKYLVMIFAGITIFNCLVPQSGSVAHFAHLGGLVYGFLFVRYSYRVTEYFKKMADIPLRKGNSKRAGNPRTGGRNSRKGEPERYAKPYVA